jgi:signal transduction histidine kinase
LLPEFQNIQDLVGQTNCEMMGIRSNGTQFPTKVGVQIIQEDHLHEVHFVAFIRNTTNEKKAMQVTQMQGALLAQQAKVETEREMTEYFSHALRNPLAVIDSALSTMPTLDHGRTQVQDEIQELHQSIQQCTTFMTQVMNNVLDIRQLEEQGQLKLHVTTLDVEQLLREVHAMLLPIVRDQVQLECAIDRTTTGTTTVVAKEEDHDDINNNTNNNQRLQGNPNSSSNNYWVQGDVHRLQQILSSVATNAIQRTVTGSVTLSIQWMTTASSSSTATSTTCVSDDKHHHHNNIPTTVLRFECRDTGPVISPQEQGRLFQRFVTRDDGRGSEPGTSLGLAIAKQIVHMMGGTLYFETKSDSNDENDHNDDGGSSKDNDSSSSNAVVNMPILKPNNVCIVMLPLPRITDPPPPPPPPVTTAPEKESSFLLSSLVSRDGTTDNNGTTTSTTTTNMVGLPLSCTPILWQPLQILIVDDIKMNRKMTSRRFKKLVPNCTISEASTGEKAIDMCRQKVDTDDCGTTCFDVILVDNYMEGAGGILHGTDVIHILRQELHLLDPIMIGCSGNALEDEFQAAGTDFVWGKPLPTDTEIVQQLVQAKEKKESIS